jgi:hypothetical protein
MYGITAYLVGDDACDIDCPECALDTGWKDNDHLPRRAQAAIRLARMNYKQPTPEQVVRLLEDSNKRGMIYRPGPWMGRPIIDTTGTGRYRDMTDDELDARYLKHGALDKRTTEALDAFHRCYRAIYDWEMDSRDGDYCGSCHEELSPAWGVCDTCDNDGPVSSQDSYPTWWPADAVLSNEGDGTGVHLDKCDRCAEDDDYQVPVPPGESRWYNKG